MSSRSHRIAFVVALALFGAAAQAQNSPVGVWKTIDDATKKEKSLIRITETGGVLTGKLEKLLDPATAPDAVCKECTDERKDKPLVGMTLIRNVKQSDGDKGALGRRRHPRPEQRQGLQGADEAGRRRREARRPRLHRRTAARPHPDLDPCRVTARHYPFKDIP